MKCIIEGCEHNATGRMRTCRLCRANMHTWEKRTVGEIVERANKLTLYRNRMASFAVITPESVTRKGHEELESARIMEFRDVKRRRSAKVVQLKPRKRRSA